MLKRAPKAAVIAGELSFKIRITLIISMVLNSGLLALGYGFFKTSPFADFYLLYLFIQYVVIAAIATGFIVFVGMTKISYNDSRGQS